MQKNEIIKQRLTYLFKKHKTLTPRIVVEDARNPASPLHKHGGFEWDVARGFEQNLINQARKLIASVKLEIRTRHHTYTAVAYVRDPRVPKSEQGYVSVEKLTKDPEHARQAIDLEIQQVLARLERLRQLAGAIGQTEVVDQMIADLTQFAERIAVAA